MTNRREYSKEETWEGKTRRTWKRVYDFEQK